MKMRYRLPSVKTLVGVTKAKRQMKSALGIYEVTRITNAPKNAVRKAKRSVGYEAEAMKLFRFIVRMFKK